MALVEHTDPPATAPATGDAGRRRELSTFLRSRRERILPEQVGLPPGGRRRTPGLRREEVAQLARVGVTWYTWLEQGREIRVSGQVLDAISATLRLDRYEREHLYTLAGQPAPPPAADCDAVPEPLHVLLRQLEPLPGRVHNARFDILASNRAFDRLFGPPAGRITDLPVEDRNSMYQMFTNPEWRERLTNWEDAAAHQVAQFRASLAEHLAEPAWKHLLHRLRRESPEFAAMWERHEIAGPENLCKGYLHPDAGLLTFNYTHLWFGRRSEIRVTYYTPADDTTDRRLRALADT